MSRKILGLIAALVAGLGWIVAARLPADPPEVADALDARVERWMASADVAGAALLVYRDDEVVLKRTWGSGALDRELKVGSAGKWMAAAALLALVDDGVLALDEPLSTWVDGAHPEITLRRALAHTSGLPAHHPCIGSRDGTLTACGTLLAGMPLRFEPGTRFGYGAGGYTLAAAAAERATGHSWADLFADVLVEPLGLEGSEYRPVDGANPNVAGGLISTVEDYARFLRMIRDDGVFAGRRVLSRQAVRAMTSGQGGDLPRVGHVPARFRGARHDIAGLGAWRDEVAADGEAVQLSMFGRRGFMPWIDRERGLAAVFAAELHGRDLRSRRPTTTEIVALVEDAL